MNQIERPWRRHGRQDARLAEIQGDVPEHEQRHILLDSFDARLVLVDLQPALELLLGATPKNSNVRLMRAARVVEQDDVDAILITGDITDDGDGYELVEAAFARWKAKGRLFAIPGNHDLYLFPLAGSGRPRATFESKRAAWRDDRKH